MKTIAFAAASALAMAIVAAPASAAILVDVSFTGTSGVAGLIRGQLEFASSGAGIAATRATILSAPGVTFSPARFARAAA